MMLFSVQIQTVGSRTTLAYYKMSILYWGFIQIWSNEESELSEPKQILGTMKAQLWAKITYPLLSTESNTILNTVFEDNIKDLSEKESQRKSLTLPRLFAIMFYVMFRF